MTTIFVQLSGLLQYSYEKARNNEKSGKNNHTENLLVFRLNNCLTSIPSNALLEPPFSRHASAIMEIYSSYEGQRYVELFLAVKYVQFIYYECVCVCVCLCEQGEGKRGPNQITKAP